MNLATTNKTFSHFSNNLNPDSNKTNRFKPTTYYTSYANSKQEIDYSSYLYSDSTTEYYAKKNSQQGDLYSSASSKNLSLSQNKNQHLKKSSSNSVIFDKVFDSSDLIDRTAQLLNKQHKIKSDTQKRNSLNPSQKDQFERKVPRGLKNPLSSTFSNQLKNIDLSTSSQKLRSTTGDLNHKSLTVPVKLQEKIPVSVPIIFKLQPVVYANSMPLSTNWTKTKEISNRSNFTTSKAILNFLSEPSKDEHVYPKTPQQKHYISNIVRSNSSGSFSSNNTNKINDIYDKYMNQTYSALPSVKETPKLNQSLSTTSLAFNKSDTLIPIEIFSNTTKPNKIELYPMHGLVKSNSVSTLTQTDEPKYDKYKSVEVQTDFCDFSSSRSSTSKDIKVSVIEDKNFKLKEKEAKSIEVNISESDIDEFEPELELIEKIIKKKIRNNNRLGSENIEKPVSNESVLKQDEKKNNKIKEISSPSLEKEIPNTLSLDDHLKTLDQALPKTYIDEFNAKPKYKGFYGDFVDADLEDEFDDLDSEEMNLNNPFVTGVEFEIEDTNQTITQDLKPLSLSRSSSHKLSALGAGNVEVIIEEEEEEAEREYNEMMAYSKYKIRILFYWLKR